MENKKELNQLTLDVTDLGLFSGLYESIWLNSDMDIDELMELGSMLGVDAYDIDASIDTREYLEAIGELYCEMFTYELDEAGTFKVDSIYSPKLYNYDTDHITITWDSDTLTIEEMEEKLEELISINDKKDDMDMDTEMWIDRGYEIYSNMVEYTYNGHKLWLGMDADDIAKVKG